MPNPKHVPQELRQSAEFAHARIDAMQASLAVALNGLSGMGNREDSFLSAFQDMDRQLVAKWDDIGPAIQARES